ncbi:hypothetical protein HKX48_004495 [Thoreauomyces humboldtii]|nr:hypothetical protein HKX48_004495 [Thoreauomyces humboldtii]
MPGQGGPRGALSGFSTSTSRLSQLSLGSSSSSRTCSPASTRRGSRTSIRLDTDSNTTLTFRFSEVIARLTVPSVDPDDVQGVQGRPSFSFSFSDLPKTPDWTAREVDLTPIVPADMSIDRTAVTGSVGVASFMSAGKVRVQASVDGWETCFDAQVVRSSRQEDSAWTMYDFVIPCDDGGMCNALRRAAEDSETFSMKLRASMQLAAVDWKVQMALLGDPCKEVVGTLGDSTATLNEESVGEPVAEGKRPLQSSPLARTLSPILKASPKEESVGETVAEVKRPSQCAPLAKNLSPILKAPPRSRPLATLVRPSSPPLPRAAPSLEPFMPDLAIAKPAPSRPTKPPPAPKRSGKSARWIRKSTRHPSPCISPTSSEDDSDTDDSEGDLSNSGFDSPNIGYVSHGSYFGGSYSVPGVMSSGLASGRYRR